MMRALPGGETGLFFKGGLAAALHTLLTSEMCVGELSR